MGLNTYPLFNPSSGTVFGGIEVRSYLFSTGLAKLPNVDVAYIVHDRGQAQAETFQNVMVYPHPAYREKLPLRRRILRQLKDGVFTNGVPRRRPSFPYFNFENKKPITLLKFALWVILSVINKLTQAIANLMPDQRLTIQDYPIPSNKWQIYTTLDADIYCAFGVSTLSAEVAAYCRHAGKKFALFIAAEHNLNPLYQPDSKTKNIHGHPAYLCHYSIAQADLVIAQTQAQAIKLLSIFNRDAIIISNPVDLENYYPNTPDYGERQMALWVGRADRFSKMPMILIQLALACPETQFIMIMNPENEYAEAEVYAACPANVIIHRYVPFEEVEYFYSQAFVLINTSQAEGFPNTFLQAAKYGVPLLSYQVDPDGFIEKYQTGIVAGGDFDKLVAGLKTIRQDQAGARLFSRNIHNYVKQHHALDEKVQNIYAAFQQIMNLERAT